MIKFTALLPRHPSMTHEEFVRYHKEVHAPLLIGDPVIRRYVRRYEQCHTGPEIAGLPAASGKFDGIAELWFDDLADVEALYTSEHYFAVIRPDEERFIDISRAEVLISTIHPVFD